MQIVKSWFDPEVRRKHAEMRQTRAEESEGYFDEIERMNAEKRKIDIEKKEKLKRALLNKYE